MERQETKFSWTAFWVGVVVGIGATIVYILLQQAYPAIVPKINWGSLGNAWNPDGYYCRSDQRMCSVDCQAATGRGHTCCTDDPMPSACYGPGDELRAK